jgi:hypothetical protein
MHSKPLPEHWVQKIFATMQGHYGNKFLRMWQSGINADGHDTGLTNALAIWAAKLGPFAEHGDAIGRALDNLPIDPPTLPQFFESVRNYIKSPKPQLPVILSAEEQEARRKVAQENIAKLREMIGRNLHG